MPRLSESGNKPRALKKAPRKTTVKQPILEEQLSRVLEQDGVPISFVSAVYGRKKNTSAKQRTKIEKQPHSEIIDSVKPKDIALLDRMRRARMAQEPKRVPIRFEPHEASTYLLAMQRQADDSEAVLSKDMEIPDDSEAAMDGWVAPYEPPFQLEQLFLEVKDLHVDFVDPRIFYEQFTPADPWVAYQEQFGWWHRLRRPFFHLAEETVPIKKSKPSFWMRLNGRWSSLKQETKKEFQKIEEEKEELIVQAEEAWHVPALVPKLHVSRVMIGFLVLLILVSLPAGAVSLSRSFVASVSSVKENGVLALAELQQATSQKGEDQSKALRQASGRFRAADDALGSVNVLAIAVAKALPQTRDLYESTHHVLAAGEKATRAGTVLSDGLTRALMTPVRYPDERLSAFLAYTAEAKPWLDAAAAELDQVKADRLPASVRDQLTNVRDALSLGQESLRDVQSIGQMLLAMAGHEQTRRYLFIFQNNTELRPTGGFMGSIAQVDMDRGDIKRLWVPGGGPYDLRRQLVARVSPPAPLQLLRDRWEFQDANWFPDFPTSAQKINWFWSKSGQPTLDGIIAVNAGFMQRLLLLTGPVAMPAYGKTITADNFLLETQKAVELEYDKADNKPKKFIGDLMPRVIEKIKDGSKDDALKLMALVVDALQTKDIQVYAARAEEEAMIERYGWTGQLKPVGGDVLSIIEANIGGQKTDAAIDERVDHAVTVGEDGIIEDTVTLTRTHNGQTGELFRGANNVSYVRVYVPQGSQLLSASGFSSPTSSLFKPADPDNPADEDVSRLVREIGVSSVSPDVTVTQEFGRTAFGGWMQVGPGKTSVTTLSYRLPFTAMDVAKQSLPNGESAKNRAAYTLLLTSQSGKMNRSITTTVHVPEAWKILWNNRATSPEEREAFSISESWDRDHVVAGLFETYAKDSERAP